jgi:hypothetical protein
VCRGSLSTFYPDAKLGLTLSDVKVTNASRLMGFFIHELNYQVYPDYVNSSKSEAVAARGFYC